MDSIVWSLHETLVIGCLSVGVFDIVALARGDEPSFVSDRMPFE